MRWAPLLLLPLLAGCFEPGFQVDVTTPYDYIRDLDHKKWTIEVDFVADRRPSPQAMEHLHETLSELVRKESIQVSVSSTPELTGDAVWSDDELWEASQATRNPGDNVHTHVLYVDGRHEDERILGTTLDFDTIVIFLDQVDDACTPLRGCLLDEVEIEKAILVHEFGHALGLVNRGIPMVNDHEDPANPGHSVNTESVMHHAIETVTGINGFSNIPTTFDANDKADICAAGGRC